MHRLFIIFILALNTYAHAQIYVTPTLLGKLPDDLKESSGLLIQSADTLWSHNDSGNSAKVFAFDKTGKKIKDRKFTKISKEDWEDICREENGYVYVGDIGNNDNNRKNLLILRFTSGFYDKDEPLVVDSLQFQYEDQTLFPPPSSSLNFDCEAFVVMNDTVFLFTKDRTKPYISQTLLYKFPATPGQHTAKYVSKFMTDVPLYLQGSVTGAGLCPDGKKLLLTGYLRMWLFTDFEGSNFFDGKLTVMQYNEYSQKESVAFVDECTVLMTDEYNAELNNGGNLYSLNICTTVAVDEATTSASPVVYFNHAQGILTVSRVSAACELILYSVNGKTVAREKIPVGSENIQIKTLNSLAPGMYVYTIKEKSGFYSGKLMVY